MKESPGFYGEASVVGVADLSLGYADPLATVRETLLRAPSGPSEFIGTFQQIIDGLPEQIALLDEDWEILAVNEAWTRTAALYGYFALKPGTNYFEFLQEKAGEGNASAGPVVQGIQSMDAGKQSSLRFLYHGSGQWEGRTFQLCVNRVVIAGRTLATVTRYDVTELIQLRQLREGFSHSLIEGQAEERRRIAREIHDSTMQLLAGLGLALGQLKRAKKHRETLDIVADMEGLLGEAQSEIRAISYLAHPPSLISMRLGDALKALIEGYGRRTGLRISLNVEVENIEWSAAKVAIYRVVQEALSNIHRHSHATDVIVGLYRRNSMYHAVVVDNGVGMPASVSRGVGLSSMRDRVTDLGGRLSIRHARPGTMLIASVPAQSRLAANGDLAVLG